VPEGELLAFKGIEIAPREPVDLPAAQWLLHMEAR
jgi:hypothetical protein